MTHVLTFSFKQNCCLWLQFPWAMKRLVFPLVCAAFVLIFIMTQVAGQQQENLYRGPEHRHANFVKHPHTFLDVSPIAIKRVHDALYCAFNCLRKGRCFSFNVAVFPDADGKYECQLLATDKYNSSDNLTSTKEFNHHSILVTNDTFDYICLATPNCFQVRNFLCSCF